MSHIYLKLNEYAANREYDKLFQIRMDKIFDTIEEYKTEHDLHVEIKDINFKDYSRFSEEHLMEIVDFIDRINSQGKIYHCDFPTFWVTSMDDLGSGPQIDELEINEISISIEYSYTHVYKQFDSLKRGFDYELEDKYKVKYQGSTDIWSSREILELMEKGAFHSEHGVIGLTPEDVKNCVDKI